MWILFEASVGRVAMTTGLQCTILWWIFIVRKVYFNRFLHPNEHPENYFLTP